jgi:ketosteroid isomerase-like protein
MSQENVERTRRLVELFHAREVEAFIAYCDPGVDWHTEFEAIDGGGYHGHDGVREFFRDFDDIWGAEMRLETEAYFDLGEHTLVFHIARARGSNSGVETVMSVGHVVRWRDGLIVHFKGYTPREEAVSALGVSLDELEPITP